MADEKGTSRSCPDLASFELDEYTVLDHVRREAPRESLLPPALRPDLLHLVVACGESGRYVTVSIESG